MKRLLLLSLFIPLVSFGQDQSVDNNYYDKNISTIYLEVNGVKRNAIVYIPEKDLLKNAPLIFVWHGHGGSGLSRRPRAYRLRVVRSRRVAASSASLLPACPTEQVAM